MLPTLLSAACVAACAATALSAATSPAPSLDEALPSIPQRAECCMKFPKNPCNVRTQEAVCCDDGFWYCQDDKSEMEICYSMALRQGTPCPKSKGLCCKPPADHQNPCDPSVAKPVCCGDGTWECRPLAYNGGDWCQRQGKGGRSQICAPREPKCCSAGESVDCKDNEFAQCCSNGKWYCNEMGATANVCTVNFMALGQQCPTKKAQPKRLK